LCSREPEEVVHDQSEPAKDRFEFRTGSLIFRRQNFEFEFLDFPGG
jgi:hypothetical protein